MNTKHTPGPWVATPTDSDGTHKINVQHNELWIVAKAYNKKDADLIAAAPDLLDALEDLLEVVQTELGLEARNAVAAIAKATGESV